jgi:RNA polymerase sigma-70 factor (ECF subfamily)
MRSDDPERSDKQDAQLGTMWRQYAHRVHGYALRHVDASVAEDVVADVFLVAWRRIDDIPTHATLPWLLTVARHTVAKHHRARRRGRDVEEQFARVADLVLTAPRLDERVTERDALLSALALLRNADREALLLVAWDGLSPSDAAKVAGCSAATFRVRLHRARKRLSAQIEETTERHTHPVAPHTPLTTVEGRP